METVAAECIEQGDIVTIEGSTDEWRVYWIYSSGQVELVNKYHKGYNGCPSLGELTLVRKKAIE